MKFRPGIEKLWSEQSERTHKPTNGHTDARRPFLYPYRYEMGDKNEEVAGVYV